MATEYLLTKDMLMPSFRPVLIVIQESPRPIFITPCTWMISIVRFAIHRITTIAEVATFMAKEPEFHLTWDSKLQLIRSLI